MYTLLVILHVILCFIMIGVILLQAGKGAEMGATFGGASQTIFGARGPATFLHKLTAVSAALFMLTSLSLTYLSGEKRGSSSIMKETVTEPASSPAAPAQPASPAGGPVPFPAEQPAAPPVEQK